MTKLRKSVKKTEKQESAPEVEQKTGSGYNPETWTEQFFREKREAEERIRKVEFSDGEKSDGEKSDGEKSDGDIFEKGIPVEKGIPGHDESEVE